MSTGENFKRLSGKNPEIKRAKDEVQRARETFWNYIKELEWTYDEKALRLEKDIETAENELWAAEYEDNRHRNWG